MRTIFLMFLLIPPISGIVLLQRAGKQLRQFLQATPVLSSESDVEKFKILARRQMYTSLFQGLILAIPMIAFGVGILTHALFPSDFIWIVLPSLLVILTAIRIRPYEQRIWAVPAETPELESQRDRIVSTWRFRAFPDF